MESKNYQVFVKKTVWNAPITPCAHANAEYLNQVPQFELSIGILFSCHFEIKTFYFPQKNIIDYFKNERTTEIVYQNFQVHSYESSKALDEACVCGKLWMK